MKRMIMSVGLIAMLFSITGCFEVTPSSDSVIAAKQERAMKEMVKQTGVPAILNFQEKKMMKMLYEIRDQEDLLCYAYLMNQMTGEIGAFIGNCIGYGLPASTQYSNPEKRVKQSSASSGYHYNIPQAEPNGLFMPEGLSATWLMMIDPETSEPRAVYIEPLIIVSPFPLK
jgi:predicted small lipoprotein YifL